jgi:hypothetical protein
MLITWSSGNSVAGVEPEKVEYLWIGLTDFESKTRFGNVDRFYIDFQRHQFENILSYVFI